MATSCRGAYHEAHRRCVNWRGLAPATTSSGCPRPGAARRSRVCGSIRATSRRGVSAYGRGTPARAGARDARRGGRGGAAGGRARGARTGDGTATRTKTSWWTSERRRVPACSCGCAARRTRRGERPWPLRAPRRTQVIPRVRSLHAAPLAATVGLDVAVAEVGAPAQGDPPTAFGPDARNDQRLVVAVATRRADVRLAVCRRAARRLRGGPHEALRVRERHPGQPSSSSSQSQTTNHDGHRGQGVTTRALPQHMHAPRTYGSRGRSASRRCEVCARLTTPSARAPPPGSSAGRGSPRRRATPRAPTRRA